MQIVLSEHSVVTIILFFIAYLIGLLVFVVKNIFDHRALRKEFEGYVKSSDKHQDKKFDELIDIMKEIKDQLVDHLERIAKIEERLEDG